MAMVAVHSTARFVSMNVGCFGLHSSYLYTRYIIQHCGATIIYLHVVLRLHKYVDGLGWVVPGTRYQIFFFAKEGHNTYILRRQISYQGMYSTHRPLRESSISLNY